MNEGKSSDPIQNAVDKCCDNLQKKFAAAHLIITHFLCGSITKADAIRKSGIYVKNGKFQATADEDVRSHVDVLRGHIRHLDRRNTILSIVEDWAGRQNGDLSLSIMKNDSKSILFTEEESADPKAFSLSLPQHVITTLCPENLSTDYMNRLYMRNPKIDGRFKQRFLLSRAAIFGNILPERNSKKAVCEFMTGKGSTSLDDFRYEELLWQLLGGLQSALLYFLNCEKNGWSFDSNAKTIIYKARNDSLLPEMMVAIILTPSQNSLDSNDVKKVISVLRCIYDKEIRKIIESEFGQIDRDFKPTFAGNVNQARAVEKRFRENITSLFRVVIQKRLVVIVTTWVIWLLEFLEGFVHEGRPLDFWFVIGDSTQFGDCDWIEFRKFSSEMAPYDEDFFEQMMLPLGIPIENSELDENKKAIKRTADLLAKEHFPWFQGGKYALFWDISRVPSDKYGHIFPFGLARICGSSWEQYLEQSYTDTQHIRLPANILAYTKGLQIDSGLIVSNIGTNDELNQHRVLNLKKGEWSLSETDGRKKKIDELLQEVESLKNNLRDQIVKICLRVADNPVEGGTLILLKENTSTDYEKKFTRMGKPWKFSNHNQDIEALVSHDGATIILPIANGHDFATWDFRFLLSADGIEMAQRCSLVKNVHEKDKNCLLSGAGARRWSAALTSLHPDVSAVIVISQDGDISFWTCPSGENLVKMYRLRHGMVELRNDDIFMFPIGGDG